MDILKQNNSYNKPSITIRNSEKHLGEANTPCLMYLTFMIRNGKLELGAHFDTNAIQYIQGNLYGLTELQKIVAEMIDIKIGVYNHFIDSLFVSKRNLQYLTQTFQI